MKDCLDQEIELGDTIAHAGTYGYSGSPRLTIGVVIKINPKSVTVEALMRNGHLTSDKDKSVVSDTHRRTVIIEKGKI